jgi:hypothetical protein
MARRQGGKVTRRQECKEAWKHGGNLLVELLLGLFPLLLLLPELLQLGSSLTKWRQKINNKNDHNTVYNLTHFFPENFVVR